jgi:hypothetical protein
MAGYSTYGGKTSLSNTVTLLQRQFSAKAANCGHGFIGSICTSLVKRKIDSLIPADQRAVLRSGLDISTVLPRKVSW